MNLSAFTSGFPHAFTLVHTLCLSLPHIALSPQTHAHAHQHTDRQDWSSRTPCPACLPRAVAPPVRAPPARPSVVPPPPIPSAAGSRVVAWLRHLFVSVSRPRSLHAYPVNLRGEKAAAFNTDSKAALSCEPTPRSRPRPSPPSNPFLIPSTPSLPGCFPGHPKSGLGEASLALAVLSLLLPQRHPTPPARQSSTVASRADPVYHARDSA